LPPPIEFKSVTTRAVNRCGAELWVFEVKFANVVGKLISSGEPTGFEILDPQGRPARVIFHVDLHGDSATLYTSVQAMDMLNSRLMYGYGNSPFCNITDEAGRSLPAFGPILIQEQANRLSILQPDCSAVLEGDDLSADAPPELAEASLGWRKITFPNAFWNLEKELRSSTAPRRVYYHAGFSCAEAMKLILGLGYDGPVKVWLDGRSLFEDPKGTNPMVLDEKMVNFNAAAGEHHLVIGFSTNCGRAWGVGVRIYRKDVPAKEIAAGKLTRPMPVAL